MIKRTTGPNAQKPQGSGQTLAERVAAQNAKDRGSETPGAGASDVEAAIAAAKAARGQGSAGQAGQRLCLIVDDSRVVRRVSRSIVSSLGYTIVEAENGEEALGRCRTRMPDLILTDWQMPVMSGIEFVSQVRALPGSERARIVFCTSKSAATDIHEGIGAGADDYVVKPFDEATLTAKLQRIGAC